MPNRMNLRSAWLIVLLVSCGGDSRSSGPPDTWPLPVSTGVGTPMGPLATGTIGAAGGTLATGGDSVRIQIPAGALAADVQVGIQMISGGAPSSVRSFRFTPDGLAFTAPATVTVKYRDADFEDSAPDLLTIGTQLPNGTWELYDIRSLEVDTLAKTITFTTPHFSDYTLLRGVQIRPPSDTIDEGQSIQLAVLNCTTVVETSSETHSSFAYDCRPPGVPAGANEDDLPALPTVRIDAASWAANGVQGGSAQVGFVAGNDVAEYVAPAQAPAGNPVAVSVRVRHNSDNTTSTLVANIRIRNSCEASVRSGSGFRAACFPPNLSGTSRSTITDADPLYDISAEVEWIVDTAILVPGKVVFYYPRGQVTFTSRDPCVAIEPETVTIDAINTHASIMINLDTNQVHPTADWSAQAGTVWTATYTDLCEGGSNGGPAGGAWFLGGGTFTDYIFSATQSLGGQTFTYNFLPAGGGSGARR